MVDATQFASFAQDVSALMTAGNRVVLCHGGGPHITRMLTALSLEGEFINGLRVTTPEVLEIVATVLNGDVQRELVTALNINLVPAVGLYGDTARTYLARKAPPAHIDGQLLDLGLVGEIVSVDTSFIEVLLTEGFLPVVSPVTSDSQGVTYNVNADIAAGSLAGALQADELIMMTDVAGIYRNWPDINSLISEIDAVELDTLLPKISAGMIPKIEASLFALRSGAMRVRILDGTIKHAITSTAGTVIRP